MLTQYGVHLWLKIGIKMHFCQKRKKEKRKNEKKMKGGILLKNSSNAFSKMKCKSFYYSKALNTTEAT